MALGKWIGGYLGWIVFGPLGGLLGFLAGSVVDAFSSGTSQIGGSTSDSNNADYDNFRQRYQQYQRQQQQQQRQQQQQGDRNSYLLSMLVLVSYIIKADGKVMHSEMEYVRQMLRQNFGSAAAQQGNDILLKLFEQERQQGEANFRNTIRQACEQIARQVDYGGRLQLLNFLVMVAQADGSVPDVELRALREVAQWMQLSASEVDSMLHLRGDTLEDAYKVLGISPSATDDEVKKAYRRLALEHHPDRVAKLGEDVRLAAEKKFQEINAAKEKIYKARGL